MTFLTGTGHHRAQIIYFLWMQIGSRTPSGIGLRSDSRLDRMRRFLGPSESSEAIAKLFMVLWAALMRELAEICWKRRRCGVGACTCIVPTLSDPRETSLAGIDRFQQARPPCGLVRLGAANQENTGWAPGTCPSDLFGPLAN